MSKSKPYLKFYLLSAIIFLLMSSWLKAQQQQWIREEVNWRVGKDLQIIGVKYPKDIMPNLLSTDTNRISSIPRKKIVPTQKTQQSGLADQFQLQSDTPVFATVIDSPPLDGFVPWIAMLATNKTDSDSVADPKTYVDGSYLIGQPELNYAIGLLDTGASISIMGKSSAEQIGLNSSFLTTSSVIIGGVTGTITADVSKPFGLYMSGLGTIETGNMSLDLSSLVGLTNVSIAIGRGSVPELPNVAGIPMSVHFTTVFNVDSPVSIPYQGDVLTAPDIQFYSLLDAAVPDYSNIIPLELRPLGAVQVEYVPDIFSAGLGSPSVITGAFFSTQSLYFVHSVDLTEGDKSAIDKDRFLLDTGAQVTVIGSRIGARLAIDPETPEFWVEIQGVNGQVIEKPGFTIDTLDIPALGEWLSFTDVPVVLLDIASPEGGTLDGIIGMNLFTDINFLLRGGGLFGQVDPAIEFESINWGDIAPAGGDGAVNILDLAALANAWLSTPASGAWNPRFDIGPAYHPDGIINFLDFTR
ncbi:MAG: hypothetical protein GY869_10165 [Planctomycetes bacterium]|nr:hypothetical protein [Planctomycetota bacterium]